MVILRKIKKIVATTGQILRLKCTKFDFAWGSVPDPTGGAYSASPDPLAEFKGIYDVYITSRAKNDAFEIIL